jgi:toxin ParE1/3/4
MGYPVVFSPSARRDLRDIVRYISLDAPVRAEDFGRLLLDSVRNLGDFPEKGRVVPEFADPALRELIVRNYRVVYRVNLVRQQIEIVRFWHATRGQPELR